MVIGDTIQPDTSPPPPPIGWQWPKEGERLEVEVEADGIALWCRAVVTAVLVDGWFSCRISDRRGDGLDWIDWFTWQEEDADWRRPVARQLPPKSEAARTPPASSAAVAAPASRKSSNASAAPPPRMRKAVAELPPVPPLAPYNPFNPDASSACMRFWLDRAASEAFLVRPTSAVKSIAPSGGSRGSTSRTARALRLDVPNSPLIEWDAQLLGQRTRCLIGDGVWVDGMIAGTGEEARSFVLRLADGTTAERVLPDHRVVLLADGDDLCALEEAPDGTDGHGGGTGAAVAEQGAVGAVGGKAKKEVHAAAEVAEAGAMVAIKEEMVEEPPTQGTSAREAHKAHEKVTKSDPAAEGEAEVEGDEAAVGGVEAEVDKAEVDKAEAKVETQAEVDKAEVEVAGMDEAEVAEAEGADSEAAGGSGDVHPMDVDEQEAALRLHLSSLAPTGFRGVRAASDPAQASRGASARSGYEVAIYVDGRERTFGFCEDVRDAAAEYARLVRSYHDDVEEVVVDSGGRRSIRVSSGSAGHGPAGGKAAYRSKRPEAISYDAGLVGRRVRALFTSTGVWWDGSLLTYTPAATRRGAGKFVVEYDDGETEEVTLPDESLLLTSY